MKDAIYIVLLLAIIAIALLGFDIQEDKITELEQKNEALKVELFDLNDQIAAGLCLPKLEGFTK